MRALTEGRIHLVFGCGGDRDRGKRPEMAKAAVEILMERIENPDNPPEKVQRLHDSVQSIAYRLQSIEIVHDRIARQSSEFPESLVPLRGRVGQSVQLVFERWAAFEPDDAFEQQRGSLQDLSHDLQQQLDALETDRDRDPISDSVLTDLYTMLGSVKGLIESMTNTQDIINQINWHAWATPRF